MTEQRYWEDVNEGDDIPSLTKIATTQTLVKWAGASGDFVPLHYDDEFAAASGVGKSIVHGALKRQWLVHLMTDFAGDDGFLKRFSCQYRRMDYPRKMKSLTEPRDGETWQCRGKVTRKYVEGGVHLVDCDIWVENGNGEATTPGKATVLLPARG
jgi:hypothetical protein